MFQCLKLLAVYVPKYHGGTQPVIFRGSVISVVGEKECIEFMTERLSRDPRVNSLNRFGARFYKNTFESLHLHLYILRLLFLST